jgi:negative regulator of flagellin synthesis FlgM
MEIENSRIAPLITQNSGQGAPVENRGNSSTDAQPDAKTNVGGTADRVSLTGEARQLKELETQIAAQPVVDSQRVAAVRTAIDNGTFTVNSERIAEKMLSLEQALTDAR